MNDNSFDFLYQNVEKLKGIGPKKASYFKNLNINTVIDIFYNLPTRSIDRTQDIDFKNLEKGQTITTLVKVKKHHFPFNPKLPYVIECEKGSLIINIIYFSIRGNFLRKKYPENKELIISGKVSFYKRNLSVAHPDYIEEIENEDKLRTFENIYPLTRGITLKDIRIVLNDAKNHLNKFDEWLNENIVKKYKKEDIENRENFRKRLAVDELVSNYFAIRYLKEKTKRKNESLNLKFNLQEKLINELPFELTKNQYKIINDINNYNNTQYRETVLLQGDVGSGKTIVSLLTAIPFIQKHKQVAYMAPTEILANQIYSNVLNHLDREEVNPILLTGSTKNKSKIYEKIEKGIFNFIIGTHAIFQENLNFSSLAYVIIDEQHRFGVQQRLYLAEKGINTNILLMSATPIPRTLALAQYGEIEQVILKEKPAFQKPIITKVSNIDKIKDIEILLKKKISNVSQVYWICPLVEASETQKYKDVETRFKSLKNIFGSEVEMLHGKIKSDKKERIIQNFQKGNIKILVATTVVEVGIDNKNADYIVIENAEKFGLSQLHQLRGRVGRGNNQGYCFALYGKDLPDNTINRLKIFKENLDGFKLSEKDLEIRGTGDILGYRQSGDSLFKFVNVYHDQELIIDALQYVKKLIEKKEYENEKFKKDIYKLLMFFKQQEAIKLLFS